VETGTLNPRRQPRPMLAQIGDGMCTHVCSGNGKFVTRWIHPSRSSRQLGSQVATMVHLYHHIPWRHLRKNLSMPLGSGEGLRFLAGFVGFAIGLSDTEMCERGVPSLAKS